jgi:hypothetical protein
MLWICTAYIYIYICVYVCIPYIYTHIHSMEQSLWKANRFASSQEISHILWNLKVHYHIRKCPPTVPIWSQLNLVHTPTSYFLKIDHICMYIGNKYSEKVEHLKYWVTSLINQNSLYEKIVLHIAVRECLLLFGAESFGFYFVWVWNLVYYSEQGT